MIAAAGTRVLLLVNDRASHQPLEWWVARMTRDRITPVTPEGEPFRWQELPEAELVRLTSNATWPAGDICIGADTPLVTLDGTRVLARDLKADGGVRRIAGWGGDFRIGAVKTFVGRAYRINNMSTIGYLEVYGEAAAVEHRGSDAVDSASAQMAGTQIAGVAARTAIFGQSAGTQKRKRQSKSKDSGAVQRDRSGIDQSLIPDEVAERPVSGDIYV